MLLMELFPDPDLPINNTFFFLGFRDSDEGDADVVWSSWSRKFSMVSCEMMNLRFS
jgi:hypothetical protein